MAKKVSTKSAATLKSDTECSSLKTVKTAKKKVKAKDGKRLTRLLLVKQVSNLVYFIFLR